MKLTRAQFTRQYRHNCLRMAFIGMSNAGKTFRARQLHEERDFSYVSVDDLIGRTLKIATVTEMADWLGYPYQADFQEHQRRYLQLEGELTLNNRFLEQGNFILDTTGSVIYQDDRVLTWLRHSFLIVYAVISDAQLSEMVKEFYNTPKPLIWRDKYSPLPKESPTKTLSRCYPELLAWRHQKYLKLADISVFGFRSKDIGGVGFWEKLLESLQ